MNDLERIAQLKKQIERLQRDAHVAEGGLKRVMSQLQEEHECSSIKDAKKKLKRLDDEIAKEQKKLKDDLTRFEEDWGGRLA